MNQDMVVLLVVGLCVAFAVWGMVRRLRGKGGGCGCGCTDGSGRRSDGCSGCSSDRRNFSDRGCFSDHCGGK